MVRSADAIARRAEKRNRSVNEQKQADAIASFGQRAAKAAKTSSDAEGGDSQQQQRDVKVGSSLKFKWRATGAEAEGDVVKVTEKASKSSPEEPAKKLYVIALKTPLTIFDGSTMSEVTVKLEDIEYKVCTKAAAAAAPMKRPVPAAAPASARAPAAAAPVAPTDWICTKCTNKNFAKRSDCNRCGAEREKIAPSLPPAAAAAAAAAAAPSSDGCNKRKLSASATTSSSSSSSNSDSKKDRSKASSWKTQVQAGAVTLEKNQKLRELFLAGQKEQLSTEEQHRAQILVKRTERRQARKAQQDEKKMRVKKAKFVQKGKTAAAAAAAGTGAAADTSAAVVMAVSN
jgi:hypothetical protein